MLGKKLKDLNLKSIVKLIWHFAWLVIILILCCTPIYFINYDFYNQNLHKVEYNEVEIKLPANPKKALNCKEEADKLNCVAWNKILQDIKIELDEYHKNNVEKQNIRLDNHDKNLDILAFVISLYAVLITVVSIFFSLKESQRIDSGLQDIEKKFTDYQSELNNYQSKLRSYKDEIERAKKEFSTDINKFKAEIKKFEIQLDSVKSESEEKFKNLQNILDVFNKDNDIKQKNSYSHEDGGSVSQFKENNEKNIELYNKDSHKK